MDTYLAETSSSVGTVAPTVDIVAAPNASQESTSESITGPRRHLVVAKYDEDTSWLQQLPKNIDVVVYQSKDNAAPHFIPNFGNEASKYLSYIVENYENLPNEVVFVQAGRQDWHDPLPKESLFSSWDWDLASSKGGFVFLPTNVPCIIEDSTELPPHEAAHQSLPDAGGCVGVIEHSPKQMATLREVWSSVFEPELGPLPQRWFTHACAQFEVTREAIRRHPQEFYVKVLEWSKRHDEELSKGQSPAFLAAPPVDHDKRNHDPERRDAGHVMEVTWALIFSDPSLPDVLPSEPMSTTPWFTDPMQGFAL
jgi:hypothetical protein